MINLTNSGWNSGLREWIIQRFTGIYISVYFSVILYFFLFNDISYFLFYGLFNSFVFKIFTILLVFSLVLHAGIGLSIILNDYIKNNFFRIFLDFLVNIILLSYILVVMQILWSF